MKTLRSILVLIAAVGVTSACEKNAVQLIAGPQEGGAAVKFFNFSVGSPQVNFFVNGTKYTATSSTSCYNRDPLVNPNISTCESTGIEATTGVGYGSSANSASGWYDDVAPGSVVVSSRIAATTDKNLSISTATANMEKGKFYSYYLSGPYDATAKTAESFIVEDNMPPVDFSGAFVRFVNANAGSGAPMILYAKDRVTGTETALGAAVAYKSAGTFVLLPTTNGYDLGVRPAGATTNTLTRTSVSFSNGRTYTITYRGNGATSAALDNTANR